MERKKKAHIIAVNMGYGHQRTAWPLRHFAFNGEIINANNYSGIPKKDRDVWLSSRKFYEFISRFKRVPLVGKFAFSLYGKLQNIPSYYPKRDLSKPTFSLKKIYGTIHKGWGKDLIKKIENKNKELSESLPVITTFFMTAFMAEEYGYSGDIFCVVCDADISRDWAPLNPQKSRIKYFAPNEWVLNRLKLYGVKEENIFLTGYPLPMADIGGSEMEILKDSLKNRILNLDKKGKFRSEYQPLVSEKIGSLPEKPDHPLTILFSIGGAGAQKEIVGRYLNYLSPKIKEGKIKVILSAGIRKEVYQYFLDKVRELKLGEFRNHFIEIIFKEEIGDYFHLFNERLKKTDFLWTKPSELSFYSALGLPILIAPPIGSQEDFNKKWLLHMGSGITEGNPKYASQWLFDSLESGRLAEVAMRGFLKEEKLGVLNIENIYRSKNKK